MDLQVCDGMLMISLLVIELQPDAHTQLLTVQFDWNGVRKDQSSVLMGVSHSPFVRVYRA